MMLKVNFLYLLYIYMMSLHMTHPLHTSRFSFMYTVLLICKYNVDVNLNVDSFILL